MSKEISYDSAILVTGGTTGLGYECALILAKKKPDSLIIIASRSSGDEVAAAINKATGRSNVVYRRLDLAQLSAVRDFAESIIREVAVPIRALVLNAGIQIITGKSYTPDGIETTFGVNHVGHALLFHLLASKLTPNARVVVVASGVHHPAQKTGIPLPVYTSAEELAHPSKELEKGNADNGRQRYSTSKLCNVLWLHALEQRRKSAGASWTVTAMDPGLMPGTNLARDVSGFLQFVWYKVLPRMIPVLRVLFSPNVHSARESGEALARLAIAKDVEGVSGEYFEGTKAIPTSADSHVAEKQQDLWTWTLDFISKDESEKGIFERLGREH